jgi:hypothetical protein
MDQTVIDRAVNIATRAALNGYPVKRVVWVPPNTLTASPEGIFAVEYADHLRVTDTPPWDKN